MLVRGELSNSRRPARQPEMGDPELLISSGGKMAEDTKTQQIRQWLSLPLFSPSSTSPPPIQAVYQESRTHPMREGH